MRNNLIFSLLLLAFSAAGQGGAGGFFGLLAGRADVVFETEYTALLAHWDSAGIALPSAALQAKQNTLLAAMKTGGAWDRLEVIYVFASGTTTTADSLRALTNWKAPGTYTGVPFGNPAFAALGVETNANIGINSTWNVAGASAAAQNNTSFTTWFSSVSGVQDLIVGNFASLIYLFRVPNSNAVRINSNGANLSASTSGMTNEDTFFSANRISGTQVAFHHAASRQVVNGNSSSLNLDIEICIGASPLLVNRAIGTFSFFSAGQEIDDEAPALYTAIQTYINSL